MGADVFIDSRVATERVRAALRGPVIRILAEGIPEIRHMSHVTAYELLLGDISLLERCFAYFRANRQRFAAILVDGEQRPVGDDAALLACGRTLNEIVAMVVRSAASRHFKKRLGGRRSMPALMAAAPAKSGLLAALFGTVAGARVPPQASKSKAQELYVAIREYLLYEWQVPLVPTYSQLTPREVATLGPRLVDLRSAEAIMVASGRPPPKSVALASAVPPAPAKAPPAPPATTTLAPPATTPSAPSVIPPVPLAPPGAFPRPPAAPRAAAPAAHSAASTVGRVVRADLASLLTEDGRRLQVDVMTGVLRDPEVVKACDNGEQPAHVKAALKAVGHDLLRFLVEEINLDKRRLAVCLVRAQAVMPRSQFDLLVRSSVTSVAMARLVAAAKKSGIGPKSSLQDCADFITRLYPPRPGGK